jgi:tetratricopeptide (TPR) repeat protein
MTSAAKFQHALGLVETGDFQGALEEFRQLVEEAEGSESRTDYLFGELLALTRLGRTAEARRTLSASRSVLNATGEGRARGDLIEVQIDSLEGNWEHALKLSQEIVKRDGEMLRHPQMRDVYEEVQWRRGMLLASFGKFRDALPLLQESLNFKSLVDADLYFQLGRCYIESGDRERAREALTKAIEMGLDDTSASTAHFNLGTIFMRQEVYGKAIEELGLAETHADREGIPKGYIYKALAVSYQRLGMFKEAKHYAQLSGALPK